MKKKLSSILGVGLALALVLAMAFSAAPANVPGGPQEAEAGTLGWSTLAIPGTGNNQLIAAGADLGPVAPSPNFSTDNTVFAAVNLAAFQTVYKSIDGGHTWSASSTRPLDIAAPINIVALAVSPQYATDSTVVVATEDYVYRSTDGGGTFSQLGGIIGSAGALDISCLDISPSYDGVGIIVIGLLDTGDCTTPATTTNVQVWGWNGALTWANFGMVTEDITAVKFSPNYPIDSTLLAIGSTDGVIGSLGTRLFTKVADNAWDGTIPGGPTNVATAVGGSGNTTSGAIFYSSIALPGDYDGTQATLRRAYVSICSDVGAIANADDVWRVTNVTAGVDMGLNQQLVNIDYAGNFGGSPGTVVGGLYGAAAGAADTYYTTNPTDSVINWYASTNPPSGTTGALGPRVFVAMDKDYLTSSTVFAGTLGTDSAFAISRNAAVDWTETGLIDNAAVATVVPVDVALSPSYATDSTIYMLSAGTVGVLNDSLWRSENAGTYWERMHWMLLGANTGQICLSDAYGTDGVVYIGDTGTVTFYYSADKGANWSPAGGRTIAAGIGVTIGCMAAPDATTLYIGDALGNSGTVAKSTNSGWVWPAGNSVGTGSTVNINSLAVADSVVLAGDTGGAVFRSTDAGASWAQVGTAIAAAGNMFVQMDGDTLYAAAAGSGNVYRYVVGVSAGWDEIGAATTGTGGAAGLALAPDGTLYEGDILAGGSQVYRSINPTAALPVPDAFFEGMAGLPAVVTAAISVAELGSGNEIAIVESTGDTVRVYSDTLSLGTAGPILVLPLDGTVVGNTTNVAFYFEAISDVTRYDVQWGTDPNFATEAAGSPAVVNAPATTTGNVVLDADALSYWHVRARTGFPLRGAWSEVWTVSPQPTTLLNAPTLVSPVGLTALDVSINPVFNWTAFKYADGYELQVAKDNLFTDLVLDLTGDNALGNVTSYVITGTLEYDTTYFWKVRALAATIVTSDWSAAVGFTTEAAAEVIIVEEPTTPAWVWAIIGVGAVLVIAVIVLITRTRRVV